jgi:hypothetical protein
MARPVRLHRRPRCSTVGNMSMKSPGKKDGGVAHQVGSDIDEVADGAMRWHFFEGGGAPASFGDGSGVL